MKIRSSILWLVAGLAVLTALLVLYGRKPAQSISQASTETNVAPSLETEHATVKPNRPAAVPTVRTSAPQTGVAPDTNATMPPEQTKSEQMKEGLATLNDVPIVFYGKLEDQFGSPVAGAQITGSVRIYNGVGSGAERFSVASDANGFFQLKGGNGESLGVMPRKDGYVLAATNTEFKYSYFYPDSRHTPDPNNPVVIKMRKLQGAEPLVGISKEYKLPFTGSALFFDLLTGKVSDSGGDLRVVVTRASGPISQQVHGDWSIELVPVEGGIMETEFHLARVTFEAPADGYQDKCLAAC
jgi:hypothetical protein